MTQQYKGLKVAWCWVCVAILALIAVPAFAEDVIYRGADMWKTTAGGFTYSTFAHDPIPANFFCEGSEAFTGAIAFEGAPLHTEPAGELGGIDTIVERLDDAVFNDLGVATTRIQLMALSMISPQVFENECGAYHVAVSLDGEQPITEMKIFRDDEYGGSYEAPLELKVKVSFTPVDGRAAARAVSREVSLGPGTFSVWSEREIDRTAATVKVDTDLDGRVDREMPPASNFVAGVAGIAPAALSDHQAMCPYTSCHCNPVPSDWDAINDPNTWVCSPAHQHCIDTYVPCRHVPDFEPREPIEVQPFEPRYTPVNRT
ncbi:MAG: hypothetical protein AAF481_07305 [Acidobacteriota bacterium]